MWFLPLLCWLQFQNAYLSKDFMPIYHITAHLVQLNYLFSSLALEDILTRWLQPVLIKSHCWLVSSFSNVQDSGLPIVFSPLTVCPPKLQLPYIILGCSQNEAKVHQNLVNRKTNHIRKSKHEQRRTEKNIRVWGQINWLGHSLSKLAKSKEIFFKYVQTL
jgi:hypothetical protein